MTQQRHRRSFVVLLAAALVLLPFVLSPASAQNVDAELAETRRLLAAARAELDSSSSEVRAAQADLAEVTERLETARGELRLREGQLALAEDAALEATAIARAAEADLDVAVDLLERAELELDEEQHVFTDQIIAFHKYGAAGRGQMVLRIFETATSPTDVATGLYRLGAVLDYQDAVVDRVDRLRDEREVLRADAERNRARANSERANQEQTLEFVATLAEQAQNLADIVAAEEAAQRIVLARLQGDQASAAQRVTTLERRVKQLEEEQRRQRLAALGGGAILCPQQPAWFQNDWGFPRSGGRTHKGTDVFSDTGTPVRAIANGTIRRLDRVDTYRPGSNRGDLGGISLSYWVSSNEYWYFAHLQRLADGLREGGSVTAGQVVGWVGNTGNAYSTPPHTHIGRYLNGSAVNPYPMLDAACRG